jgi:hypothetical protein
MRGFGWDEQGSGLPSIGGIEVQVMIVPFSDSYWSTRIALAP